MLTKELHKLILIKKLWYSILIGLMLIKNLSAFETFDSDAVTNYKLDLYLKQNCKCTKIKECNSLLDILTEARKPMPIYIKERFRKLSCNLNEISAENQEQMVCCVVDGEPNSSSEELDIRIDLSDNKKSQWIWDSKPIQKNSEKDNPKVIKTRHLQYPEYSDEYSNENFIDFEDPNTHKNCPPSFDYDDKNKNVHPYNRFYQNNNNFYPKYPPTPEFTSHTNEFQHGPLYYPYNHPHPNHRIHHPHFHGNHLPIDPRIYTKKPRKANTPPKKFNDMSTSRPNSIPSYDNSKPKPNFDLNSCGISIGSRIIGGTNTLPGQFPWLARIGYKNLTSGRINYRCIGSLINSRYILTAAHCMTNLLDNLQVSHIRFNEINPIDNTLTPQDYQIEQLIPHQFYDTPKYANDIGLMRITFPANTPIPTPICLPIDGFKIADENIIGKLGVVAGWKSSGNGLLELQNPEEQWVQLPIVNTTECANSYAQFSFNSRIPVQISEKQLCAQGSKNNDACQGDSGGPLMVQFNDRYTMVGLVSFGPRTCGVNNLPGVYTRISSYVNWISTNVRL